jgi:hypothetical protein
VSLEDLHKRAEHLQKLRWNELEQQAKKEQPKRLPPPECVGGLARCARAMIRNRLVKATELHLAQRMVCVPY